MNEPQIRLAIFIGLFAVMAILEMAAPRRRLRPVKRLRWLTNWAIVLIDSAVVRLLFKTAAVGGAIWAQENGYGIFNRIAVSPVVAGIVAFLVLDLAVWASHVASHKVPMFWRIHRMHHSDIDFDVTTAIRFHPIEIVLSMLWKYAVVVALGAPAAAVLAFEIVLNGGAMFNHANFRLPQGVDRWLRLLVVTPDMHRVHHSTDRAETDSNYGFNLSIWDRMFGTYVAQPKLGHEGMTIGIGEWQDEKPARLDWSLLVPFRK
jgi:sterol desaturase/sphingolipid hydroxylase (fatty acid hydroxylase superfamily)